MKELGLATRAGYRYMADDRRVITRLFYPGQELVGGGESRTSTTIERVLALSANEVEEALSDLFDRFANRHEDIASVFDEHAEKVREHVASGVTLSKNRRLLLGAAFTQEYSIEGSAVCNPSLVAHFDQTGVEPGALRVILSYRAIGEGHISSICFRAGMIDANGTLAIDPPSRFPVVAATRPDTLDRSLFLSKLSETDSDVETAAAVLDQLGATFTEGELETAVSALIAEGDIRLNAVGTALLLLSIARSFYVATFDESVELSRRVLWPASPFERHGMEDARFVRFEDDSGVRFMATYTAFDGTTVSQQLLETRDFRTFVSMPLTGEGARNKGLAIFPRLIDGEFAALSRFDRQTNSVVMSNRSHHWDQPEVVQEPIQPWELLQLGNCGSPIELPEGWLVLTHGVGAMRTYSIGALLLDLDEPRKVIARLSRPLLVPTEDERDGYVPNVVYSCGSLVHAGRLYMPYGMSDCAIGFAVVDVADLLGALDPVSGARRR